MCLLAIRICCHPLWISCGRKTSPATSTFGRWVLRWFLGFISGAALVLIQYWLWSLSPRVDGLRILCCIEWLCMGALTRAFIFTTFLLLGIGGGIIVVLIDFVDTINDCVAGMVCWVIIGYWGVVGWGWDVIFNCINDSCHLCLSTKLMCDGCFVAWMRKSFYAVVQQEYSYWICDGMILIHVIWLKWRGRMLGSPTSYFVRG